MIRFFIFLFLISSTLFAQEENNPHAIQEKIIEEGRTLNVLNASEPTDLPIGISSNIGGQEYVIGIDSFVIDPEGSYISASSVINVPASDEKIPFYTNHLLVTPSGVVAEGGKARIILAEDKSLRLNNNVKLILKASEKKTYIEFGCSGFIGMGVQGEFEFCRNMLIPEMEDGSQAPEPARVKAKFETYMSEWGNLLAKVSITPFQLPNLKGFGFHDQDAWVDQSDLMNPANVVFPLNYQSTSFTPDNSNFWQGFFIKSVSVKLPKQFNSNGSSGRKEILAANLLIDNMGVSGSVGAKNLINFEEGSLSGWPFSIDSLGIGFTCNKITGAAFKGKINLPIAKEKTQLLYSALIENGNNYFFNIKSSNTLEVPLWAATMNLDPTSSLDIIYQNDQFIPKATLNGSLSVKPELKSGDQSEFKGIRFENLIISSSAPYIIPGTFSIESTKDNGLAGFKVSINNIGVVRKENLTGLQLNVAVHLMKDSDGGFSGQTGLTIFGKMEQQVSGGRVKWNYDHVSLNEISLATDQGAFKMNGLLRLYKKDLVYGSGFKGQIDLECAKLKMTATAQFGKKGAYNYWYADALMRIDQGVTLAPGLAAYGVGGGLYHHMKLAKFSKPKISPGAVPNVVSYSDPEALASITPPPSGNSYIPDSTLLMGFKSTVIVGSHPTSKAFNADATFEIAFNKSLGINYINISGSAYFMTDIDDRSPNAPVRAAVDLSFDFPKESVHGTFDVFVNIPATLVGTQGNNLAGGAVLHFDPSTWYIHVGTPDTRIGLRAINILSLNSYLMIGKELPAMPLPPDNVSKILGGKDLDFMRNESVIGTGGGFAFGASLDFNTGKQQFLVFYGQFQAGVGFDIMMKDYGKEVQCEGRNGSLGINGFYASGQAWAFMQGEVGIKVDLVFVSGEFKILELGAAAVLQAKLPNPVYMEGNVGGYYSILGGKIKGNCAFTVKIGEQCKITGGSALSGMKIISGTTPAQNENDVNVFNNPQATFTLPVDKTFELEDLDGTVKSFRIKLRQFKVLNGANEIVGSLIWNHAMDVVAFNSSDIFPRKTNLKLSVKVYFEENKNGQWQEVILNGKPVEELVEYAFKTGDAPKNIPASNVKYSYPQPGQFNFLKNEYSQGYVQLIKGQDDLLTDGKWKKVVRFKDGNNSVEAALNYDGSGNNISYNFPASLQNNKVYTLEFVNIPVSKIKKIDQNVSTIAADSNQVVSIESKTIEGNLDVLEDNIIYQSYFRSSKYNTFMQKMSQLSFSGGWRLPILQYQGLHELGVDVKGDELFDKYDISPGATGTGNIRFEAGLNNKWFKDSINPMVYAEYPIAGDISVTWRDVSTLGLPPAKAILIRQNPDNKIITDSEVEQGSVGPISDYAAVIYNLPFYIYKDYLELQQKAARHYYNTNASSPSIVKLMTKSFPGIMSGNYDVEAKYILPGINKITSTYKFSINNQ